MPASIRKLIRRLVGLLNMDNLSLLSPQRFC